MVAANVFKHERSQGSHLGPPIACTSLAGADPHDPENVACLLPKLSVSKEKKTDMKLSRCLLPVGKHVDSAHYFHQLQLLPLSFKVWPCFLLLPLMAPLAPSGPLEGTSSCYFSFPPLCHLRNVVLKYIRSSFLPKQCCLPRSAHLESHHWSIQGDELLHLQNASAALSSSWEFCSFIASLHGENSPEMKWYS